MLHSLIRLEGSSSEDTEVPVDSAGEPDLSLFNIAIAIIFAREVLEGAVIVGQFRTVIIKADTLTDEYKTAALRTIRNATIIAVAVAALVVAIVAIPLGLLSRNLNHRVVEGIEGASKMVATICILQFSLKLPLWMNVYRKVSLLPWKKFNPEKESHSDIKVMSLPAIRFNIIWNIWRETAECGVFLIPFFLGTGARAIPLSALVGIVISVVIGMIIYVSNNRMTNKGWLVFFMSSLTLFLSVGMFVGGSHEFEELAGESPVVYEIENPACADDKFPFVLLVPFGYSSTRTVVEITTFWCWLTFGCVLHYLKWRATQWVNRTYGDKLDAGRDDIDKDAPESAAQATEGVESEEDGIAEKDMEEAAVTSSSKHKEDEYA